MTRMQDRRVWLGGAGLIAVLVAVIAWFAVISPVLSSASSWREEAESTQTQNVVLQAKITKLAEQKQSLGVLTASLRNALAALPVDSGLPAFTRQLTTQAQQNRVALTSISVGAITQVVTAAPAAPAAPAAGTPAADGAPADAPAAAGAVAGGPAGKLYGIQLTIITTAGMPAQIAFLQAVQATGPRRALILSTQLTPASGSATSSATGSATMSTELIVFAAPLSPQDRVALDKLLRGNVTG